jgi:hypothetical protein
MPIETDTTYNNKILGYPHLDMPAHPIHDVFEQKTNPEKILSLFNEKTYFINIDSSYIESPFVNHLLKPVNFTKHKIDKQTDSWIIIPFFIVFLLLIYITTNFYKRSLQAIRAPFSKRGMSQLERDGNIFKETIQYPIYLIEISIMSILLFQIINLFLKNTQTDYSSIDIFWLSVLSYFTFILLKNLILKILAYVFEVQEETYFYRVVGFLLLGISSIAILPFLLAYQYTGGIYFLHISVSILALTMVYKVIRGFQIWSKRYNYLKIFAYLCTVEILPYLLIAKTILNIIK